MSESVLRIVIDSRNAERNARNLSRELNSIERTGNHASSSMDSMSVATRNLAGYMLGLVTVGTAISKMDMYTGLQNRLKLVTDSQTELNTAMSDTFGIAQKTAATWDSVAMVYQRFADNADRLGISMKTTAELTETVSKAISVSGGSAASAEAALMQFGQALASGVLRGEEFNSIAEQAPGLLKAIAFGLDTNVGALRAMAANGEITGDVLVESLGKAKPYIDDLFNKTDFTIAQEFTRLSNEVTKFVGEAGKGTGAASALGSAIGMLSQNLGTIADIAVVGGVAMLTKFILAQTVAIYGSITASMARRASDLAALQSQVRLAGIEVQRTRQVVALAATEVHLARIELNGATTRTARAAATMRLTQAEIALSLAQKQKTAATIADTAAQNANNAARSRATMLLGAVGGWTGVLTIGVAALAAGYMYLKNRTAEANAKLEEQGKVALETDESLKKLSGNDKISAVQNLTAAFDDQNKKLAESKESVDAVLFAIRASSVENEKARKVTEDAKNGVISYNQAIELLNKMDISPELYEMLKKQVIQYDENAEKAGKSKHALGLLGKTVELVGNLFQNSAVQVAGNTEELNANETAAQKAAKAQADYQKSLADRKYYAEYKKILIDTYGFSQEKAEEYAKAREKAGGIGAKLTEETKKGINETIASESVLIKLIEDQNKAEKEKTNQKTKQLKITQAELEVAKRSAALVESSGLGKYAESKGIPSSVIAGLLAQESKGIRNAKSHTGAIGYFQTTSGYRKQNNMSVADSYDLEKSGKIAIDNIAKVYEKTGDLAQAILSHNAGESGAKQFTKTGKVTGSAERNKEVSQYVGKVSRYADIIAGGVGKSGISEKDNDRAYSEQIKARLELVKQGLNLQEQYESEQAKRTKDRNEEINLAQQTGQTALIPKIKERYDAQDKLAKLQQEFDVEGHKWTEERKLQYTYDTNVLRLTAEGKFSDDQKKIVEKGLKDQLDQEKALIELAKEERIFQMQQGLMHANAQSEKYWNLERERIERSVQDLTERNRQLAIANELQAEEKRTNLNSAAQQWGQTQANMSGTGEQFQLEQERFGRYDESQELFDAQMALAETAAQREAIWQAHHDRMSAIESDYHESRAELERTQHSATLDMYRDLLNQAGSVWGDMTQMVKDSEGEQSGAFKAMFLAQQMFAMGSALISTHLAAAQVLADPTALTLAQKSMYSSMILGMGYANVGLIAGQTIAGFANGGYTGHGGKYDVAGLVHKGEGVLTQEEIAALGGPQGFNQLRASIKNGYSDGGLVKDTSRISSNALSAISSSSAVGLSPELKVNIINNVSNEVEAKVTQTKDGLTIEMVRKDMVSQIGDRNSQVNKAMRNNFNISAKG